MTTVTLVHNPTAGLHPVGSRTLLSLLDRAGYQARYVSVKNRRKLLGALRQTSDMIVAAGGDGTVAKVLATGSDQPRQLAIIPLGVANNVARSLGIVGRPPQVIGAWPSSRLRPFDLATLWFGRSEWPVVESIGFGALAEAARTTPHHATSAFSRTDKLAETRRRLREVLPEAEPIPEFIANGEDLSGQAIFAEVLNIPFTGPNLALTPEAVVGDRLLSLVYATEEHREDLLAWLDAGGNSVARPALPTITAEGFRIRWSGATFRFDDDFTTAASVTAMLRIGVRRSRMRILAPPFP